jgi:hypothetical protein
LTQCGAGMPLHLARVRAKFFHVVINLTDDFPATL